MSYFSEQELKLIETLGYRPELEPSYDAIKNALIWEDERPNNLSPDGYEKLCDLWIARSFIHRGIPFSSYKLSPEYFEKIWLAARKQGFKWPGFYRLNLSDRDKNYYIKQINETLIL